MDNISIEDAEKRLAELAQRVERGETIVLTRNGAPVADIVPHQHKGGLDLERGRKYLAERGITKLVTFIAPDFDAPLPEDFLITPLPELGSKQ